MTIHLEDGNPKDVLKVLDGLNVVGEGFRDIIVYGR